jgi:hypothetical protein
MLLKRPLRAREEQYLDAPELQRFWEADAKKLGDAVRRVGKLEYLITALPRR